MINIRLFGITLATLGLGCAFLFSMRSVSAANVEHNTTNSSSTPKVETKNKIFEDPDLHVFSEAIKAADLTELFNGTGPFTAFAPTNQAFEKLGQRKLKELLDPKNKDALATILIYHIVPGKYMSNTLRARDLKTVNGKEIEITVENGEIKVNGARIVKKDLVGPNGVLHEIDAVLLP